MTARQASSLTPTPAKVTLAALAEATPFNVDILVLYTPATRTALGGATQVQTAAQEAIDNLNGIFSRSLVPGTATVVGVVEVPYTESGALATDLARLRNQSDGFIDNTAALRNQYGADLVTMLVEYGSQANGFADIPSSVNGDPNRCWSVVTRNGSRGIMPHEICHNLGCGHDRQDGLQGTFTYSYAHVFTGDDGVLYTDLMGYRGRRNLFLSNPDILSRGQPTGVAVGQPGEADHALTVELIGPKVAAYRSAPPALSLTAQDIGSVGIAGSTSQSGGIVTVTGAGADVWGASDAFHYAYQEASGDCEIIARVDTLLNTHGFAMAGVMIRETTAAGSKQAFMTLTPTSGSRLRRRTATSGSTSQNTNNDAVSAPYWVRLVRAGNTFTGYKSINGTSWTQVGSVSITMNTTVKIGLGVCSHTTAAATTATFSSVSISP